MTAAAGCCYAAGAEVEGWSRVGGRLRWVSVWEGWSASVCLFVPLSVSLTSEAPQSITREQLHAHVPHVRSHGCQQLRHDGYNRRTAPLIAARQDLECSACVGGYVFVVGVGS